MRNETLKIVAGYQASTSIFDVGSWPSNKQNGDVLCKVNLPGSFDVLEVSPQKL